MVKDEDDIIEDWLLYHGYLFGYENLFVVDNMSEDNTFPILEKYKEKGVKVTRHNNYLNKGTIMSNFMKANKNDADWFFTIDADEFIIICRGGQIEVDKETIHEYLENLPDAPAYKMNWLEPKIDVLNSERPCTAFTGAYWLPRYDYFLWNKTFFKSNCPKLDIDIGNHGFNYTEFQKTKFRLLHFHYRGNDKIFQKYRNGCKGFGYNPNDLESLEKLDAHDDRYNNHHVVKAQIRVLKEGFKGSRISNNQFTQKDEKPASVSIQPFVDKLEELS